MRILHVVPTYLPARRYGGPIVAVHGLCRALTARGHEVDVMTTNVDGDGVSDVPLEAPVLLDGVSVRYFASPFPRLYWSPRMRRALADAGRYDLVHVHSVFLWPTTAAARAAARGNVPYVVSPRGMLVGELIRQKSRLVKSAWLRLVERRTLAGSAAIHFTSRREWDDARGLALPLPSPFVVPNGIDLVPRPDVARDPRLVVYLGRINWKKRIDVLIEALPADARLIVAGNDEEGLTPKLRELARGRDVELPGPVYGDAKWELLARASVFALPSLSENFGNAVLEAMMMETPVVVSSEVGISDAVAEGDAGIVMPLIRASRTFSPHGGEKGLDVRGLSAALHSLLGHHNSRLGRNGRALVESRFTWPRVAAEMEEAYCSLTSRR